MIRFPTMIAAVLLAGGPALADEYVTIKRRNDATEFKVKILERKAMLRVENADGKQAWISPDEWEITSSEQPPATKPSGYKGRLMQVMVTGAGLDPEQAKQNAYSSAIEQAVGVLVDAETLVENDKIVRDRVLTFSRGQIEEYSVVSQWQTEGLHYVRIQAQVALDRLAEKLTANKIDIRDVPGELLYRQAVHELVTKENAAEMLRKAMSDYTMDRLFDVEVLGSLEKMEEDKTHAKVRLRYRLSADLRAWEQLRRGLIPLLQKVATHHTVFSTVQQPLPSGIPTVCGGGGFFALEISQEERDGKISSRLDESAPRVHVFSKVSKRDSTTEWHAFSVPKTCIRVLEDIGEQRTKSCVALLNASGEAIVRIERPWPPDETWDASDVRASTWKPRLHLDRENDYWLGPFFWGGLSPYTAGYSSAFIIEETVDIELKKLLEVDKAAAFVEVTADQ